MTLKNYDLIRTIQAYLDITIYFCCLRTGIFDHKCDQQIDENIVPEVPERHIPVSSFNLNMILITSFVSFNRKTYQFN